MEKQIINNINKYGNLGGLLKELRKEKGYTQDQLSRILDISKTSLIKYEQGGNLSETSLIRLMDFFNINPSTLMSESFSKTEEIKEVLEEEYYTIKKRIHMLSSQLESYQLLADDLNKVLNKDNIEIETTKTFFKDENYQYSGSGDTFLEDELRLDKGIYRIKGYYKPKNTRLYSTFTIKLISKGDDSVVRTTDYRTPYQPFSKAIRVAKPEECYIAIEGKHIKNWAFSILPA